MYDLPAMVDHVCKETGYDKIAFIGHSQGNGLAFISLSLGMCPSLGDKLSVFIALAPAVYAGPLTTGFPFTTLNRFEWSTWKRFFGVLDFIPLMRWAYDYAPAKLFVSRQDRIPFGPGRTLIPGIPWLRHVRFLVLMDRHQLAAPPEDEDVQVHTHPRFLCVHLLVVRQRRLRGPQMYA